LLEIWKNQRGKRLAKVFKIGSVSRQTAVSVSTLRVWEEQYGLLSPLRTDGGTRLYSPADVDRARRIRVLVHDRGYSLAAIANYMEANGSELPEEREAGVHAVLRKLIKAESVLQAGAILVDGIKSLTALPTASLGIYSAATSSLMFIVTSTISTHNSSRPPLAVAGFPLGWQEAIEARQPYASSDLRTMPLSGSLRSRVREDLTRSFYAQPLTIASRLVGVLVVGSPKADGILEPARDLAERLAVPAGPAIEYFAARPWL
jgi:DNA-binding transcriptional MerR regulator